MAVTKIEWTATVRPDGTVAPGYTFNPWRGCTKVSAGCANCYAETLSGRNPKTLGMWGPNGTRVVASEAMWREPLKWDRIAKAAGERHRVFCASLADVFEDWTKPMVDSHETELCVCHDCGEWMYYQQRECKPGCTSDRAPRRLTMQDVRNRLFRLIDATPNLDWLLLTKRPENIAKMVPGRLIDGFNTAEPRGNVWLGTSVENQAAADERIPHLLRTPAAVRFLSCEPLLGPLDIAQYLRCESCLSPLTCWCKDPRVNWVIVGGESGHGARVCDVEWIRSIVEQCKVAGVPCFVKQLGSNVVCENDSIADWFEHATHLDMLGEPRFQGECERVVGFYDRKGGNITEWPLDIRVREFPKAEVPA